MDKKKIYIVKDEHKEQIIWSANEERAKEHCYLPLPKQKLDGEEVDYISMPEAEEKVRNAQAEELSLDNDYKTIEEDETVVNIELLRNNKNYYLSKDRPEDL